MNVIGLSGFAGSGKDLFCEILCEKRPEFSRKSLGDNLKRDIRSEILKDYNIDILDCTREEKDKVRPKLIDFGREMREKSNGRHWINSLTEEFTEEDTHICVTDIRYDEYPADEVFWLKDELRGVLVHIERYDILNNNKKFVEAPNEDERRNDPILKAKATYNLQWHSFEGNEESVRKQAGAYVEAFLRWFDGYNESIKGQPASLEGEAS